MSERHCISCKTIKAESEFYRYAYVTGSGRKSTRYESRCADCCRSRRRAAWRANHAENIAKGRAYKVNNRSAVNAQMRAKRAADVEAYRQAKRVYQMARKHKMAKQPRGHSIALVRQVLEEARIGDKYLDAYTGDLIDNPEIDHIVPISRGGKHEYDNLCVTSKANNSRKHAQSLLSFFLSMREAA